MTFPMGEGHGYVLLRVGGGRYAVAMDDVGEIGRHPDVTRVPGLPSFVAGMANWRGAALAVVDARVLLGQAAPGPAGHIAVLRRDGVELGLLVDGVEGVMDAADPPSPVPAGVGPATAVLLRGTLLDATGAPVAVLDTRAVIGLRSGIG
jgi:chemotaxis signal transduction protein